MLSSEKKYAHMNIAVWIMNSTVPQSTIFFRKKEKQLL